MIGELLELVAGVCYLEVWDAWQGRPAALELNRALLRAHWYET